MLPGPDHFWWSGWVICAADVCYWPYVVGMVKFVTFLGTLHCPAPFADLGVGSVSWVEFLFTSYPTVSQGRAANFSVGCSSWFRHCFCLSCRFVGCMVRALCPLPGGLGRFVRRGIGAKHCRLRHIGFVRVLTRASVPCEFWGCVFFRLVLHHKVCFSGSFLGSAFRWSSC